MKGSLTSVLIASVFAAALSFAQAKVLNEKNPEGFKQFRIDYAEMVELASPDRLAWRIFYDKPSEGPDAVWFDAVKQGDLETVKKMVADGQDIEVKDEKSLGQTALGWAAFIGYEDMVDYFFEQDANVWATDRGDVANVAKSAALGRNVNVFKKSYDKVKDKMEVNNTELDMQGETMLIVAASNDRRDIVEYLFTLGADPNIVTTEKDTNSPAYDQSALSFACDRGNDEMVKILVKNGAVNHRINKPACE